MRSNRLKQNGVGEWMVAQIVIPDFTKLLTTSITCQQQYSVSASEQACRHSSADLQACQHTSFAV